MSNIQRLKQQIAFLMEIDHLKNVFRQTLITDGTRNENDAEHSWHLGMLALILAEHANAPELDLLKVIKMVLIHDIVEIDAGDTFAYDVKGHEDKQEREEQAAERIFGLLPGDQKQELIGLWMEFEAKESPESRFAAAIDRIQPMLHNYYTKGAAWQKHQITREQVIAYNRHMEDGSTDLWAFAQELIDDAVEQGYLLP